MDVQSRSSINFKANVSQSVLYQIQRQLKHCESKKKSFAMVRNNLDNIKNWGSPDSSIVVAKDFWGRYRLGVQCQVAPGLRLSWAINNLKAKTELSQFISLTQAHIEQTETSIKYLYKKYGIDIFKKYQDL